MILLFFPLFACADEFVAGKEYQVIGSSPVTATHKINVVEFFSYGCPWCFRLEPKVNEWVKKHQNQITFSRVPVVFHPEWIYYAKAYYTANLLGQTDKFTPLMFKTIQTDKKTLSSNQAMINLFIAEGVNKDIAESAFNNSTTIDMKMNEGTALMAKYHINAVPAFVVNNQYKVDLQMTQDEEKLFKVLDYLLEKSKK